MVKVDFLGLRNRFSLFEIGLLGLGRLLSLVGVFFGLMKQPSFL